ncbi:MAG: hypothetical protein JNM08_07485, partial [Rubrivivax sp.]|nr:hypothetical protein [Rubrivivax sp.]
MLRRRQLLAVALLPFAAQATPAALAEAIRAHVGAATPREGRVAIEIA